MVSMTARATRLRWDVGVDRRGAELEVDLVDRDALARELGSSGRPSPEASPHGEAGDWIPLVVGPQHWIA